MFVKNYASKYGLPQPAAPRARPDIPPIYLPYGTTKTSMHDKYRQSAISSSKKAVGYTTFDNIWRITCPDIQIMSRREDCCSTCEAHRYNILHSRNSEEAMQEFQAHLTDARHKREYYNSCITEAKAGKITHLLFDFAEQLCVPSTTRQIGPLYFKVCRRYQLFGVCNTSQPLQHNYIIDEHQTIGMDGKSSHGPNSVVSMLHYYLVNMNVSDKLVLHADNCAGQNKNKTVFAYLSWRIVNKLNTSIELNFLPVGHTRSLVDGCFGLAKMKYRRTDCYALKDVVDTVNNSAKCNTTVVYPEWKWYDWDTFLLQNYRRLPNISKVSKASFSSNGCVTTDLHEEGFNLLKRSVKIDDVTGPTLPETIAAAGFSEERRQYLHSQVAPFVPYGRRDDFLAEN